MLKFYLMLQVRRIQRKILDLDLGVHPIVGYFLIVTAFLGLSIALFFKIKYILYLYLLIAMKIVSIWSNPDHRDFLKLTYSKADYYKIRLTENLVSVLPFVLCLACSGYWLDALILLMLSVLMIFYSFKVKWKIVIPTPFYKYPYEFIIGFRLSFCMVFLAYFLTYIAMRFNYKIGYFAIITVSILCIMFYMKVEDPFYVWIFSSKARQFLFEKIRIAVLFLFILCLPILVALSISNPDKIPVILAFQLLGTCYLTAGVLCKYTSFPDIIHLRETLFLLYSVMFPPLLLFTLPFFYIQSARQLEGFLE